MSTNIKDIVARKNWNFLVKNTLPVNIADCYSVVDSMKIIGHLVEAANDGMLKDRLMIDFIRDYCVNLMIILRAKYPKEWNEDWKNEAFLGIACSFVYREEEAFEYIKNAYKQVENPPQSLILAYIGVGRGLDHFLTKEEVIELSHKAIEKGVTYEAALGMAALANEENDEKKQQYWKKKAFETEKDGIYTPIIIPNVLKDVVKGKEGYRYEE